jgi:hypothetical protein
MSRPQTLDKISSAICIQHPAVRFDVKTANIRVNDRGKRCTATSAEKNEDLETRSPNGDFRRRNFSRDVYDAGAKRCREILALSVAASGRKTLVLT